MISQQYFFFDKLWCDGNEFAFGVWSHLPPESRGDIISYNKLKETHNTQVKYLMGKGFLSDYIVTEDDCDMLIERMEELDFKVGIVERMKDSIKYFNKSFNYNMDYTTIPHRHNNSQNKKSISKKIKNTIIDNNEWDIKLYNYYLDKLNNTCLI